MLRELWRGVVRFETRNREEAHRRGPSRVTRSRHVRGRRGRAVSALLIGLAGVVRPASADPGDLDTTFDGDGKVTTQIVPSADNRAADMVLQPDGKIVLAGTILQGRTRTLALARYNADGSLDTTSMVTAS